MSQLNFSVAVPAEIPELFLNPPPRMMLSRHSPFCMKFGPLATLFPQPFAGAIPKLEF